MTFRLPGNFKVQNRKGQASDQGRNHGARVSRRAPLRLTVTVPVRDATRVTFRVTVQEV